MKLGGTGYLDNWDCEIRNCCFLCMIFVYLVNVAWGFSPAQVCDPNMDNNFFFAMVVHKRKKSLCITMVAFFDRKHF